MLLLFQEISFEKILFDLQKIQGMHKELIAEHLFENFIFQIKRNANPYFVNIYSSNFMAHWSVFKSSSYHCILARFIAMP